jgi:hypothetical protein
MNLRKLLSFTALTTLLTITGCASVELESGADNVLVSPEKPPKGCKYLGQATGNQGNFFTGAYTSNKNLESGSMNDLRNQAAKKGANYIQMLTNRAGVTGSGSSSWSTGSNGLSVGGGSYSSQQTNVTTLGNAYHCPQSVIDNS